MSRTELIADAFFSDPAVREAKGMMLEALARHQEGIREVRPPRAGLVLGYEEVLAEFARMRGGGLYFPYLGSGIGNGPLVELGDGSIKYDFICGIGVHHFGHSHPALVGAALEAALGDTVMQGNLQQNLNSANLTADLLAAANAGGAGFDHCFLSSSGVMAGENALKIAFQKKAPADRVLAFEHCFAGRTLTFSQITDKPAYRDGLPLTQPVDYVPFYEVARPEESGRRALAALNAHLARYPGRHAAMLFELVQGEGGFHVGSEGFFRPLMERCGEAGVAVLVDEVQTFARTPSLFAYDHFGLGELVDVVWIGKAAQVCATLFRKDYAPRPGLLSQTFTAGSAAIAAGVVMVRELMTGGYFGEGGKIERWHGWLAERLGALEAEDPALVRGPFGIGLMVAFTPYEGDAKRVGRFVKALFERGVMSFVAGSNPMRVRFLLPAGALSEAHLEKAWEIVEATLREGREKREEAER